jgi:hypothetical protein
MLPLKYAPNSNDFTTNPLSGDTDAVTDPDLISVDIKASSDNAFLGIFLK